MQAVDSISSTKQHKDQPSVLGRFYTEIARGQETVGWFCSGKLWAGTGVGVSDPGLRWVGPRKGSG